MMKSIGRLADEAQKSFVKFMARPRKSRSTTTRRKPSSTNIEVEAWQQRCYELTRENERLKFEAQDARAQLMQLRIDGGAFEQGPVKRIGYMIGTFIPEGVLLKLRRYEPHRLAEFKRVVVDAMVDSALKAMYRVNENGKQVAMVFMPYGTSFKQRANLPVFEVPQGHHLIVPQEIAESIETELRREAEDEHRKLLRY